MRKPVVDYRRFRLSRLNNPEFSHLKLLFGWIVFLAFFFLTENLIPREACYPVRCRIDDRIPFQEIFLIPYVFWYGLILFSLVWFGLYDLKSFRNLSVYFIIIQFILILIYIVFPTRQELRPEVFPRNNLLTRCVALLYRIDTNTGVCPSFHAAGSIAMGSVWSKTPNVPAIWKGMILLAAGLICLSTMFIKQHSAVDVLAAVPVCLAAEGLVYQRWFSPKRKKSL